MLHQHEHAKHPKQLPSLQNLSISMALKRPVASRFAAQQRDILAPENSQGAPEVSGRKKSMNCTWTFRKRDSGT
jgi:hypothetical protein